MRVNRFIRKLKASPVKVRAFFGGGWLNGDTYFAVVSVALVIYCITSALSIVISQIALGAINVYWIFIFFNRRKLPPSQLRMFLARFARGKGIYFLSPLLSWCLVALISGILGIRPLESMNELLKTCFWALLPFSIVSFFAAKQMSTMQKLGMFQLYILFLAFGQSIAGLHSMVSAGFGYEIAPRIPGPVTESGQLALVIPALLGVFFSSICEVRNKKSMLTFLHGAIVGLLVILLVILIWPQDLNQLPPSLSVLVRLAALLGVVLCWTYLIVLVYRKRFDISYSVSCLLLPILFTALIVNLKRGPWFAVLIELLIVGMVFSRKLLWSSVAIVSVFITVAEPVQSRLGDLYRDFSISGGRQYMWELGWEIAQRYPLGVGIANSSYIQKLDPSLPPLHRHLHNNLLNILVETGWIGLFTYIIWFAVVILGGLKIYRRSIATANNVNTPIQGKRGLAYLTLCLTIAILGWQIAGFVEYNFGDGEVRLIAFFYLGLLASLFGDALPRRKFKHRT